MKRLWKQVVLGICLAALLLGTEAFAKDAKILEGVSIGGVDVSDMTAREAEAALSAYLKEAGEESLELVIGEHTLDVKLSELGLSCNYLDSIEDALNIGQVGNIVKRYKDQKILQNEGKNYPLYWKADEAAVRAYVEEKCTQYDQEAENASLIRKDGEFEFKAGKQGLVLNVDASVLSILDYVENEWTIHGEKKALGLETKISEPEGSMEQLSYVKDLLGTFSTSFSTSNSNRRKNVASGAEHINGTVLYPGEEFSAYETVSPFTEENGYAMAGSYLNGEVVDSMGGGICQVSTTLYNAVLRAELEVTERSPHSMIVHYVNLSEDAAIAGTYKDFKFKNSTDYPIYIEGYTTDDKRVVFNIFGKETRDGNRSIRFESVKVSEVPGVTRLQDDPSQPIGHKRVSSGDTGYVAELYKVVSVNGVETERIKVNKSTYKAGNRVVTYGTAGDPVISENLRAAIALQDEGLADANIAPYVPAPPVQ